MAPKKKAPPGGGAAPPAKRKRAQTRPSSNQQEERQQQQQASQPGDSVAAVGTPATLTDGQPQPGSQRPGVAIPGAQLTLDVDALSASITQQVTAAVLASLRAQGVFNVHTAPAAVTQSTSVDVPLPIPQFPLPTGRSEAWYLPLRHATRYATFVLPAPTQ